MQIYMVFSNNNIFDVIFLKQHEYDGEKRLPNKKEGIRFGIPS